MNGDLCIFGMGICVGIPVGIFMMQVYAEIVVRKRRRHPDKGLDLDMTDDAD